MKKLFAFLLVAVMVLSLAACGGQERKPSGSGNIPGASRTDKNNPSDDEGNPSGTAEKCAFCFDMEGNDRKCDTCGHWIHEKGEAWTKEVPDNLKAVILDYRYNYQVIEKVGDQLYIKEFLSKEDYENDGDYIESFVTMTAEQNRDYYNDEHSAWRTNGFAIKYGDVYEMFAVKVLQNLVGSSLSSTVEECLAAPASGAETVAGKECVIKEYDGFFGMKYKVWMWNNLPLKKAQMDTNADTEYTVMYEILKWNTDITEFSQEMPQ